MSFLVPGPTGYISYHYPLFIAFIFYNLYYKIHNYIVIQFLNLFFVSFPLHNKLWQQRTIFFINPWRDNIV